jgi:hypothetical protein
MQFQWWELCGNQFDWGLFPGVIGVPWLLIHFTPVCPPLILLHEVEFDQNKSVTSRWPTYPTLEKPKEEQNQLSSSQRVFHRYPFNCSVESSAMHIYIPQPCMKAWWMRCEKLAQKVPDNWFQGGSSSWILYLAPVILQFFRAPWQALNISNEHNASQPSTEKYKCPIQNHSLDIFCSLYPKL